MSKKALLIIEEGVVESLRSPVCYTLFLLCYFRQKLVCQIYHTGSYRCVVH